MITKDFTPRPKASQDVAAAQRQRATADDPAPVTAPKGQLFAIGAAMVIGLTMLAISWQLAQTPARPLQLPTVQPTTPATIAPAALSVPTALPSTPVLPTATPVAPEPTEAAPVGRGATITEIDPTAAPPSYIEVVGQQAPHSPRGDGQPGPAGGDHVLVPTLTSMQLVIVGSQAPHKVR